MDANMGAGAEAEARSALDPDEELVMVGITGSTSGSTTGPQMVDLGKVIQEQPVQTFQLSFVDTEGTPIDIDQFGNGDLFVVSFLALFSPPPSSSPPPASLPLPLLHLTPHHVGNGRQPFLGHVGVPKGCVCGGRHSTDARGEHKRAAAKRVCLSHPDAPAELGKGGRKASE